MTPQEMIEMLVCPACKKALLLKDGGKGLKCTECRRVYPVRDGLPIMLIEEAIIDPS
jgi:LSD1 subclass zinc finger protein